MNSKWYISTLIILLAFIGVNQEQTKVANQQIVLQFSDLEQTSIDNRDDVLSSITEKLAVLGISDIEISEDDEKGLSIRYYSTIDAESVGEFLSNDNENIVINDGFESFPSDSPEDELPDNFSLIVSDLQQPSDHIVGVIGKLAFVPNHDYNSVSNPLAFHSVNCAVLGENFCSAIAFKVYSVQTVFKDNTSNVFPEVRAGPYSQRVC